MLEVVFGDNAAGSMSIAIGHADWHWFCGGFAFVMSSSKRAGREFSRAEFEKARQEAEARERRGWEEAVPLEGSDRDIVSFDLLLSVGDIDENGVGAPRKSVLRSLYPEWADDMAKTVEKAQENLSILLERAGKGESVRIWSSSYPDDACGLYWLLEQLRPIGFENLDVTVVRLPEFQERPDGTAVQYAGWGEVEPYQFGRMAGTGERLPVSAGRMMADRWKQLQRENAPLRAVLNGRLVSAPESLYDPYILREIDAQDQEFRGADVVGNVIGKYQLGIGDGWIVRRMEQFIRSGILEPVTQAGSPFPSRQNVPYWLTSRYRKICTQRRTSYETDIDCRGRRPFE